MFWIWWAGAGPGGWRAGGAAGSCWGLASGALTKVEPEKSAGAAEGGLGRLGASARRAAEGLLWGLLGAAGLLGCWGVLGAAGGWRRAAGGGWRAGWRAGVGLC